jgi:hypothetical protein
MLEQEAKAIFTIVKLIEIKIQDVCRNECQNGGREHHSGSLIFDIESP